MWLMILSGRWRSLCYGQEMRAWVCATASFTTLGRNPWYLIGLQLPFLHRARWCRAPDVMKTLKRIFGVVDAFADPLCLCSLLQSASNSSLAYRQNKGYSLPAERLDIGI